MGCWFKAQVEAHGLKQQFGSHQKRLSPELAEDEGSSLSDEQKFDMACNTFYEKILCNLKRRFGNIADVACEFQ